MKYKNILASVLLGVSIALSGCTKDLPPGDYDAAEVGKVKKVVPGVILSKRAVRLHKNSENTEGVVDNTGGHSRGFEYVIKLNSGQVISLVQTENLNLKTNQRVLVIYGPNTRVVADEGSED